MRCGGKGIYCMELKMIREIVSKLTLEEKAGLTSGKDNWYTKAVERLGVPSVRMSDGPHGLRTQAGEVNSLEEGSSIPATCYPTASDAAASFDRELIHAMGTQLGREAQALGVNVLLGPGINMKRSPLCGRNFEYYSEDPYLAGQLGAAFVNGVQSQGVGTSLKHFAANSQETRRMDASSEMDERTFREIYLPAFEYTVKLAQPWTVMASYNKIGGVYSTENKELLEKILREEWGFEGVVTSDWGATHNRAGAIAAGCDVTMPAEDTDAEVVKAVQEGRLSETDLDECCVRMLQLAFKAAENVRPQEFDYEAGHQLARKIAAESAVLLKNDGILPLKNERVAFIGGFAEKPRYQGGGSSHINSYRVTGALDAAQEYHVTYVPGYNADGTTNDALLSQATEAARVADVAVVFIGLTDEMESEGVDRRHMNLPAGHNALVEAVCAANSNTVVVLHNGSPVEMPWAEKLKAILEMYLGGQAVGEATVDVLWGKVNPCGHLAESFPKKLEDNPSYLYYLGEGAEAQYAEGLFIGYRYYESKKMDVLFPFGHGLSYTTFAYSNLKLDKKELDEKESLSVSVDVTNTGKYTGKAVVQIYVAPKKLDMIRPVRELKGFSKVELAPGETKTVTVTLAPRAFQYWNKAVHGWKTENTKFAIQIGLNSHEIVLEETVKINAEPVPPVGGYSLSTPMTILARSPKGKAYLDGAIIYLLKGMIAVGFMPKALEPVLDSLPEVNLGTVAMLAQKAGRTSDSNSGLLAQPVNMLTNFLPQEKKDELNMLIAELNK